MSDPKPIPCGKCDATDCRDHAYCGLYGWPMGPVLRTVWVDRAVLLQARGSPFREHSTAEYWADMALMDAFNEAKRRRGDRAGRPL